MHKDHQTPVRSLGVALIALWVSIMPFVQTAEELPLISTLLTKTQEKEGPVKAKEPDFPKALDIKEAQLDIADLLPGGAFFYLEIPSGASLQREYDHTHLAQITNNKEIKRFLQENPFTLETLLSDLPARYSTPGTITILRTFIQLIQSYLNSNGMLVLSAYPGEKQEPVLVFLVDIGRDRKASHEQLQMLITQAREKTSELMLQKAEHTDDYLEILRAGTKGDEMELCYGFIRNYLIVTSKYSFANTLLLRAAEKQFNDSLGDSQTGADLTMNTSPQSHIKGFFNLFSLLDMAVRTNLPDSLTAMNRNQSLMAETPLYYDLQFTGKGVVENITVPLMGLETGSTALSRLKAICQSDGKFTLDQLRTIKLMPYNPDSFFALRVKPDDLAALIQEESFSSSGAGTQLEAQLEGSLPALKTIFAAMGNQGAALIDGEIGISMETENSREPKVGWTLVIPLRNTGGTLSALAKSKGKTKKVAGLDVYSQSGEITAREPAWAVFAQTDTTFRNLGYSFLVVTSSGTKMEQTIDSIIGGRAVLANNQDFQEQMKQVSGESIALGYDNLLKKVQSNYFHMPTIARQLFPRIVSLQALPQMTSITNHLFGISSSLRLTAKGEMRLTAWSPAGLLPSTVAETILSGPMVIRLKEEWLLLQSRKSLAELNLALQEYATQHGHYPVVIHGEVGRQLVEPLLPANLKFRELLTSPAALEKMIDPEAAAQNSYIYVSGLLPSDVPETVILYNSQPFHYLYSDEAKKVYEPSRLVLRLDGNITVYSESVFNSHILPTIRNR